MQHLRLFTLLFLLLATLVPPSIADGGIVATDKGWNRAALFAALLDLAGPSASVVEATPNLAKGGPAAEAAATALIGRQSSGLAPGDHIWFLRSNSLGSRITLAGSDDLISTISIYSPIVEMDDAQQQALAKFNGDLFGRMFPDWPVGKTWLFDSLGRTWSIIGKNWGSKDPKIMATFVEQTQQGPVYLSSTGTPPDIHFWRLTTLPNCRINIDPGQVGNPYQRWVC